MSLLTKELIDRIFILDNLFTEDQCKRLIDYYNHGNKAIHPSYINVKIHPNNMENLVKYFAIKLQNTINKLLPVKIQLDWGAICGWWVGSTQEFHKDLRSKKTVFTSVTYLNDDFNGGYTQFKNDFYVVPKIGRTVFFDGQHYEHGVSEVENNPRYSLAIWYKLKEEIK